MNTFRLLFAAASGACVVLLGSRGGFWLGVAMTGNAILYLLVRHLCEQIDELHKAITNLEAPDDAR